MLKKILGTILIIIVYAGLYILSHVYTNYWYLFMFLFLSIIFAINFVFFKNKNYSWSFISSSIFTLALLLIIGVDRYLYFLNMDLNAYVGIFYEILAAILLVIGLVLGGISLLKNKIK